MEATAAGNRFLQAEIPGHPADLCLHPEPPFLKSSLCPYFVVSILERVVPLITEAVVEVTVAGSGERRGFLAHEPISAFTHTYQS